MAETLLSHGLVCLSEIDSNFNADETYLKCRTCSLYQRLLSLQPSVPRALLLSRLYLQHTLLLQLHLCRLPVGRLLGGVRTPAGLSGKQRGTTDSWHTRLTPFLLFPPPHQALNTLFQLWSDKIEKKDPTKA